ncbi:MAG TPA: polysaccharide biosynthesis/export family protein [Pirellulales bacterium]|nr:polysaccharide biosynthesis/export family protein [Pirellulales bacterium]
MNESKDFSPQARFQRNALKHGLYQAVAATLCVALGTAQDATPRSRANDQPMAARTCRTSPMLTETRSSPNKQPIQLCQALGPAAPYPIKGLDCATGVCGELGWDAARPIPWQRYAQGEYVGHERLPHVDQYRIRVDDELEFVFRLTRTETSRPYQLNVGDELRIESLSDPTLNRDLVVQPDGNITLPLVNEVRATQHTIVQLRQEVEERLRKFYKEPAITVTPVRLNTRLEDLRATSDARFGFGGQSRRARVTPEGTIQLPALGSVPVQGLTLPEVQRELHERLGRRFEGMEITPVLAARAPRYVYVVGEVRTPGRYELTGPTTAMQAISMAGGWIYGGNLWNTVVFRRGDDWRLLATRLDLRGPLYGRRPCPADEIWLNDSDVVLIPKSRILVADNIISLLFTQGLYGVAPFSGAATFSITRFGAL